MHNLKTYTGKYAPNPKEFGRWIDATNTNGAVAKVYRNGEWVEETSTQKESLTKGEIIDLIANSNKSFQTQISNLIDKINYLERELKRIKKGTAITEQQSESKIGNII